MPSAPARGAAGPAGDDVPDVGPGADLEPQFGDAGIGLLLQLDAEGGGGRLEERLALAGLIGAAEGDDGQILGRGVVPQSEGDNGGGGDRR